MAPVAPFLLSLLAVAGVAEAGPLQPGRHMAPAVYNKGLAGHARREFHKLMARYYGDSQGMVRCLQVAISDQC
jgi:glucan endo-1,3-alpha-glucosidase